MVVKDNKKKLHMELRSHFLKINVIVMTETVTSTMYGGREIGERQAKRKYGTIIEEHVFLFLCMS